MLNESDDFEHLVELTDRLAGWVRLVDLAPNDAQNRIVDDLSAASLQSIVEPQVYVTALGDFFEMLALENIAGLSGFVTNELELLPRSSKLLFAVRGQLIAFLALVLLDGHYPDRKSAIDARALLDAELTLSVDGLSQNLPFDLYEAVVNLCGSVALELARTASNAAALIQVETGVAVPVSKLVYQLYGDPERAGDLVARNGISTPLLMPLKFEALYE